MDNHRATRRSHQVASIVAIVAALSDDGGIRQDCSREAIAWSSQEHFLRNLGGPPDVARPQKRERQKGRRPNVAIEASRRGQRDDCLKRSIEFEQTLAHELQALEMRIDCYANTA